MKNINVNDINLSYNLSCLSQYEKTIEQEKLTNSQIISNTFYIPYLCCQGAYSDIDVCFMVELFYGEIKIFECEINFELFDDNNDEEKLKKIKWKPVNIFNKYIENYFNNIEYKECYILNSKLFITFDIDLEINGYEYEQMYGIGSYDWDENKIIDLYEVWNIRDDHDLDESCLEKELLFKGDFISSKDFVKKWLYENERNKYKYGIYSDAIYFIKNKELVYHEFGGLCEDYITFQNYNLILYDKNIFGEWKPI